ncbi:TPA: hypothetical protein MCB95_005207 [Klebsiella pneumoniae]|nr:hypothetical protein [Providencia rettgeri]
MANLSNLKILIEDKKLEYEDLRVMFINDELTDPEFETLLKFYLECDKKGFKHEDI